MTKEIDLNTCKPGDKLLSKNGLTLEYVCKLSDCNYHDHEVRYPNGAVGERMNDGFVYKKSSKRLECDYDIVEIFYQECYTPMLDKLEECEALTIKINKDKTNAEIFYVDYSGCYEYTELNKQEMLKLIEEIKILANSMK